jgi:hypothetical protein
MPADAKFCPHDGTSLQSLSSKPTPRPEPTPTFTPFQVNRANDDENYLDRIDHLDIRINHLEVEINAPKAPEPDKLGAIAMTTKNVDTFVRPQPFASVSDEDFLKTFQKEAGPSKGSIVIG